MPGKSSKSTIVAESMPPVRRAKAGVARMRSPDAEHKLRTGEMLNEIRIRGEQLSSDIKELLVRLG